MDEGGERAAMPKKLSEDLQGSTEGHTRGARPHRIQWGNWVLTGAPAQGFLPQDGGQLSFPEPQGHHPGRGRSALFLVVTGKPQSKHGLHAYDSDRHMWVLPKWVFFVCGFYSFLQ